MYIMKNPELLSRVPACSESSVENVKTLMFACSAVWSTGYKGPTAASVKALKC